MKKQIGQTKDVGFQFGIRKTISGSTEDIWDYLFSPKGLKIWLGELETEFELKKGFRTKNGVEGYVRLVKPNSHIRINWKRKDWTNLSTLQMRLITNKEKTTISFHQEKLGDSKQREEVKNYWSDILDKLTTELTKEARH
ncbi:MAG: SRPBCC domain-containing protein [Bacteroidota bacterium]